MRYAGFWPRLAAALVDGVVLAPLLMLAYWGWTTSRTTALAIEVPLSAAFAFYNIYFIGRWGQTVGKMALKIKVVALDGADAGFRRAFYRHGVDLAFSVVSAILVITSLTAISSSEYDVASFEEKMELLTAQAPSWQSLVDWLSIAWVVSELVVLLMNEKRRAVHDFIAGTVVVHRTTEAEVAV
jgi:uncharacterized RDD family membrane protein YckC